MKYTTVLFDLDGTLTKSEEGITKTAIYAAEKMGFTGFAQEQFKVFIGRRCLILSARSSE